MLPETQLEVQLPRAFKRKHSRDSKLICGGVCAGTRGVENYDVRQEKRQHVDHVDYVAVL